jgi:polysaccharide export outer membrane protein
MRRFTALVVLVVATSLALGAFAQATNKDTADKTAPAPDKQEQATASESYVIGPDDTLHVSVWKEPDLTETVPVRSDGKISMPLLNDVQAAGLTATQLAESITTKLKKYLEDPRVTIVVTGMNSQRVYVMGEVNHTGAMPLTPDMTVLQALASAGFTQFANTKGIYVLRTESGKQVKLPFNYKQVIKGEAMNQNIALKPGDTIVVP